MASAPDQKNTTRRIAAADTVGEDPSTSAGAAGSDAEYWKQAGEFVEHSPDAILRVDAACRITHANRSAERVFEQGTTALVGRHLDDLNARATAGPTLAVHAQQASASRDGAIFTIVVPRPAGDKHFEVRMVPVSAGGAVTHLFASLRDISGRLAKTEELNQALREQETIFEGTAAGLFVSRDRIVVKVNRQLEIMFGYAAGEMLGMHSSTFRTSRRESDEISANNRERMRAGETIRRQALYIRKDGSTFWAEIINRPLVPGRPEDGVIGVIIDISEQKAQEQQLQQALREQQQIFDTTLVGMAIIRNRRVVKGNAAAAKMFGLGIDELAGLSTRAFFPSDEEYEAAGRAIYEVIDREGAAQIELPLRHRSGQLRWTSTHASALSPGDPDAGYIFGFLDIEARKRTEQELRESEARFRQFADNVDRLFFITNPERTVCHYVNDADLDLFGVPAEAARRDPHLFLEHVDAGYRDVIEASFVADRDGRGSETEVLVNHPAKGKRWIRSRTFPVTMDTGEVRVFGIAEDVTERRMREEARIQEAMQQRDVLVREVHHRIKNNLQGVAGLLEHTARTRPAVARELKEVIGQIQAIAQVHGLQVREGGEMSLLALTRAIVDSLGRLGAAAFRFHNRILRADAWIIPEHEAVPLALVINELLTNALKYGAAGGVVEATLETSGEGVIWHVSNEGRLADGFDFATISAGAAGLSLVKALLPRKGASLTVRQYGERVLAELVLLPPVVRLSDD
ncbi:MAG TPA: PAS domain S-box protein [Usitatibacteraceae bacterium]